MYGRTGAKRRVYRKKPMFKRRLKTGVRALARDIAKLKKQTANLTERDQYSYADQIDAAAPYVAFNLCNYSSWSKMWTSSITDIGTIKSKMYHRYMVIDSIISLDNVNNEEGEINFTYMIISRRDTAGSASDTGAGLSLQNAIDYAAPNGKAFMNLKKWKVHYARRFTLTGGDGADMQADNCLKRITAKIKVNTKVENSDGHWRQLTNSPDPSDTYYAVLFNDNLTTDLENPRWKISVLHSVDN